MASNYEPLGVRRNRPDVRDVRAGAVRRGHAATARSSSRAARRWPTRTTTSCSRMSCPRSRSGRPSRAATTSGSTSSSGWSSRRSRPRSWASTQANVDADARLERRTRWSGDCSGVEPSAARAQLGLDDDWVVERHHGRGQLRGDLQPQPRAGYAARPRPRPQRALDRRRPALRPAVPLDESHDSAGREHIARPAVRLMSAQALRRSQRVGAAVAGHPRPARRRPARVVLAVVLLVGCVAGRQPPDQPAPQRGWRFDFGFLDHRGSFDISRIAASPTRPATCTRDAFLVGLVNTLLVSVAGHRAGDVPGHRRRRRAPVEATGWSSKIAAGYVEIMRNTPLLVQLVLIYAVLLQLPSVAERDRAVGGSVYPEPARAVPAATRGARRLRAVGWHSWSRASSPAVGLHVAASRRLRGWPVDRALAVWPVSESCRHAARGRLARDRSALSPSMCRCRTVQLRRRRDRLAASSPRCSSAW